MAKTGDISEFQKKSGWCTKGEVIDYLLVVVGDCETGTHWTHPWLPAIIGKKGLMTAIKDAKGDVWNVRLCNSLSKKPEGVGIVVFQAVPGTMEAALMVELTVRPKGSPYHVSVLARELNILESDLDREFTKWRFLNNKKLSVVQNPQKLKGSVLETERRVQSRRKK